MNQLKQMLRPTLWIVAILAVGCSVRAAQPTLQPGGPLLLEKTQGRFDFLRVDASKHRLLLAHTGNKSLDVFDLDSRRLLKSVPTGAAQDSAMDAPNGKYFVAVS